MTNTFAPTHRASLATVMMLSCCAALAGEPADAAEADTGPRWTFGGFGTLGVARSNADQADFTANDLSPGAVGYSRRWSPTVDSRVGVQAGVDLNSAWSAVVQLVSERTLRNHYTPSVEWAYLQYRATPDLSLRAGRITLPLFLTGDYRKAGYALPWVRPPVEVYGAIPLSSSDGVDVSYRWQVGRTNNVTQLFYGRADVPATPGTRAQAHGLSGVSHTATTGALTLRASVLRAHLSVDFPRPLFDGLRGFGAQGQALADEYELDPKHAWVATLGFNYDPGRWFAMGEIARLNAHSFLGDKTVAYVSSGYRHGDLTPYLTYAVSRPNVPNRVAGLDLDGQSAQRAAAGAQLNGGLNQLLAAIPRQNSISAGVRWDFHSGYALKLQYDRILPLQGSTGTFINVQPGFRAGQPVGVVSAALDFVF
ncbi:hypothetical protein FHW58_001805 [Duganella sp. 1224]|uniref:hypothetical protein n=1 Tax=Duganella sp. 1224 TaxID=2587052 RepID=UPI0018417C00|nr:hypothetical protein [Duganella sp. 1224]NYE60653.1 hypothetical protein [Duganella sp. 1224]